jgi:hypothetical protein
MQDVSLREQANYWRYTANGDHAESWKAIVFASLMLTRVCTPYVLESLTYSSQSELHRQQVSHHFIQVQLFTAFDSGGVVIRC